jgi:RP/EB family microtubule-associated protein
VKELKQNVEALERERDFYFGKLRDVEILLQTYGGGDKEMVDKMFKILYATEEDFVTVDVSRVSAAPFMH